MKINEIKNYFQETPGYVYAKSQKKVKNFKIFFKKVLTLTSFASILALRFDKECKNIIQLNSVIQNLNFVNSMNKKLFNKRVNLYELSLLS